ncbi:amino acid transporter putative [Entamoeba histolytica]|nr:amino acid transporter putative [Entamoeba histolytica]
MESNTQPLIPQQNHKKYHTYSFITCFAVVVNYIVGTGVFGLPSAFYSAGVPLSTITILIFCILSCVTAIYVIETLSRSHGYAMAVESGEYKCEMGYEVYDYSSMAQMWGGKPVKWATTITLMCSAYGSLWAYVATCVSTLSTLFWLIYSNEPMKCDVSNRWHFDWKCNVTYFTSIAVYGLVVIPLTFIDLTEQSLLQLVLTVYRFVSFLIMFITCAVQLGKNGPIELKVNTYEDVSFLKEFRWVGFGSMFTHVAFALACQQNLPDALAPLNKKKFSHIATLGSIILCCFIYIGIALVTSWCFTTSTPSPVTLAWADYNGYEGGWGVGKAKWWAIIIKYMILLFPIVNLTNEFPLVATTLSTNMRTLFRNKNSKRTKFITKALAAFPPFILTCAVGSLRVIFDVTGSFSFVLCFSLPCIFHYLSRRKVIAKFNKTKTPFSGPWSRIEVTGAVFIISLLLFITAVVFIIKELVTNFTVA